MKLTSSLLLLSFLSTATSQAAFTLVNDFDSGIGSWDNSSAQNSNISNPLTTATFGSGSNYVDLSDASTGGFGYESSSNAGMAALGDSGTIALTISFPNTSDWFVSLGRSAFSADRAFTYGSSELYTTMGLSANTSYEFSILYNITASAITYDDPTISGSDDGSLAAGSSILYAQPTAGGSFVKSGMQSRNGTVPLEGLWLTKLNSTTTAVLVDDLQQSTSLEVNVVPEPSTALLGAIGVLALLRRRR